MKPKCSITKVKLSLCLTWWYMLAHRCNSILNFDTKWKSVVTFKPRSLYPMKSSWYPMTRRLDGSKELVPNTLEKIKIICPYQEMSQNTSVIHIIAFSLYGLCYHTYNLPLFITGNTMTGLCTFIPQNTK